MSSATRRSTLVALAVAVLSIAAHGETAEDAARAKRVRVLNDQAAQKLRFGDARAAERLAREAEEADPEVGRSYVLESRALAAAGDVAAAITRLDLGIERLARQTDVDRTAEAYADRARLDRRLNDPKAAIADAEKALALNPKSAWAYHERGLAEETLDDLDAALADLRQATALSGGYLAADTDAFVARNSNRSVLWRFIFRAARVAGIPLLVALLVVGYMIFGGAPIAPVPPRPVPVPVVSNVLDDVLPRKLDAQYELVKKIGEGGMGAVYEGVDSVLKRRVAVKMLRIDRTGHWKDRERFLDEAKIVAHLHHPHIVEIYNIHQGDDQPYLVFEYLTGSTLQDYLLSSPGHRLTPVRAIKFLGQIAEALDHAHAAGVIHRDLKPANVMVTTSNGREWLKVMDFGLARQVEDAAAGGLVTSVVGTPAFMAPEQMFGEITKASDIYSMGMILYEMLTGVIPFQGPGALAMKVKSEFEPASTVRRDLPRAIDVVIKQSLSADIAQRYKTCRELALAAEAALGVAPA